jgi:hypothetical protein
MSDVCQITNYESWIFCNFEILSFAKSVSFLDVRKLNGECVGTNVGYEMIIFCIKIRIVDGSVHLKSLPVPRI